MIIKQLPFLCLSLLFAASCTSTKQQPTQTWRELDAEYRKAYSEGEYELAVEKAGQAVTVAEKEFGAEHFFVVASLNNLSRACRIENKTKLADKHFSEALTMTVSLLDTENPLELSALAWAAQGHPKAKNPQSFFKLNTLPWIKWGNNPMDESLPNDRLETFMNRYLSALAQLNRNPDL